MCTQSDAQSKLGRHPLPLASGGDRSERSPPAHNTSPAKEFRYLSTPSAEMRGHRKNCAKRSRASLRWSQLTLKW